MGEKPIKTRDLRGTLPYGMWSCSDGREVLFDRSYKPIWTRRPGEPAVAADRQEWVDWAVMRWAYDHTDAPFLGHLARRPATKAARLRCETLLEQFKDGLPVDLRLFIDSRYGDGLDAMFE